MTVTIYTGSCMDVLPTLEAGSVQCVVTSPPFYALRAYGTEPQAWGGDPEHEHVWDRYSQPGVSGGTGKTGLMQDGRRDEVRGPNQERAVKASTVPAGSAALCSCGAWRGELGSEPTPDAFVATMVAVFREVKRVLRDDGCLLVNLGDSYAGSGKGPTGHNGIGDQERRQGFTGKPERFKTSTLTGGQRTNLNQPGQSAPGGGLPTKSLLMIPFRVSLALQGFSTVPGAALVQMADGLADARRDNDWAAVEVIEGALRRWAAASAIFDGWILRSVIPWIKRNPLPESVQDRPASAIEYLFLFSKQSRYFWDSSAIRMGAPISRVKMGSHFVDEREVLRNDFGLEVRPPVHSGVTPSIDRSHTRAVFKAAILLAASILQVTEPKDYLSLFSLHPKIGHQDLENRAGLDVIHLPVIRRAASHATAFTNGDITAEQFLCEIRALWVTLPDGDHLYKAWRQSLLEGAAIDGDGNATVRVNDTGHVGEVKRVHQAILSEQSNTSIPHSLTNPAGRSYRNSDAFMQSWQGLMLDEAGDPMALVVNPMPLKEAHFASFPPGLVEPFVKAGTSEKGACPSCGAGWVRKVIASGGTIGKSWHDHKADLAIGAQQGSTARASKMQDGTYRRETTGWAPACTCNAGDPIPQVVLDPFAGAGTTLMVADRLGRDAIGIELSPIYAEMARARIDDDAGPLLAAPVAVVRAVQSEMFGEGVGT